MSIIQDVEMSVRHPCNSEADASELHESLTDFETL